MPGSVSQSRETLFHTGLAPTVGNIGGNPETGIPVRYACLIFTSWVRKTGQNYPLVLRRVEDACVAFAGRGARGAADSCTSSLMGTSIGRPPLASAASAVPKGTGVGTATTAPSASRVNARRSCD